jgi:signal transduction histidine kinase
MIIKAPLMVAVLMSLMSSIVSYLILDRMAAAQQKALAQLAEAYLDGVSTALMPHVIRRDSWEVFDTLDRAREHYAAVKAVFTVVALPGDQVLASSNPSLFPVLSELPWELREPFVDGHLMFPNRIHINEEQGVALVWRPLMEAEQQVGDLFAELDISHLLAERRQVLFTLLSGAFLLTLTFVLIGYAAVRWMVRPIGLLSHFVESVRDGYDEPLPANMLMDQRTEFGLLFKQFDAMKDSIREREELATRLAEEEKLALIGKLASSMAHEVNNPLGGMRNVIDTIRKHGSDEITLTRSLDLLERGLEGIANVTRATLVTYKGGADPAKLAFRDMEDIQLLVQHIVKRRRLNLLWLNTLPQEIMVDGTSVRQIALNLLLNACEATPEDGEVGLEARMEDGRLMVVVRDQGPGIPEDVAKQLISPSISGVPEVSLGLGAWTVGMLTKRLEGRIEIGTNELKGTKVTASFPIGGRV